MPVGVCVGVLDGVCVPVPVGVLDGVPVPVPDADGHVPQSPGQVPHVSPPLHEPSPQ